MEDSWLSRDYAASDHKPALTQKRKVAYKSGVLSEKDLETSAFNVFLYGRMIGAAAEIDDHLNRGKNMDTRTPLDQCGFVV